MTNILILNFHSSANVGDQALLETAVQQFRAAIPNANITVAVNDETSRVPHCDTVPSLYALCTTLDHARGIQWRLFPLIWYLLSCLPLAFLLRFTKLNLGGSKRQRQLLNAYHQADFVVSCAGGFLYSSGKVGLPLRISLYTFWLAFASGKLLYILPQSIGPLWRPRDRWITAATLRRVSIIQVRDRQSETLVQELISTHPQVQFLTDLALAYTPDETEPAVTFERPKPWIGVTVIDWGGQNKRFQRQPAFETAVVQSLNTIGRETGGSVIFLPQVTGPTANQDDRIVAQRIATQLDVPHQVVTETLSPSALHHIYGQLDCLLGTRMHSVIFAVLQSVPFVGVAYLPKLFGFAKQLDLNDWIIAIEDVKAHDLEKRLQAILQKPEQHRERINAKLLERRNIATTACANIVQHWNTHNE